VGIAAAAALVLLAGGSTAHAAGYFSGTKGARAAGRAGAFTVAADDLSAVMFNPAGLARLESRFVLQVGNRFSYNGFNYTRDPTLDWGHLQAGLPPYVEFPTVHSQTPWQAADPLIGLAGRFRDWGFALAALAPPGVGRQAFPIAGGPRYQMVGREAIILNYSATVAWGIPDLLGFGVSLQWIHVPRLNYSLIIDANQSPGHAQPVYGLDALAEVKGTDVFTPNAVVGAWFRPASFLEFGASGQVIPTQIKTKSTLAVSPLFDTMGQKVELKRDGELANDVTLSLPLPITARVGVRYLHQRGGRRWFDLELNVGYESWSRVDRLTVGTNGLTASLMGQNVPLGTIGVDKRWRDTLSVHLGGDVIVVPGRVIVRGGLMHESAVADRRMSAVDFVSGRQYGGAVGASVFAGRFEIAAAYEFRMAPSVYVSERDAGVYQQVPGSTCVAPYTDPARCNSHYLGRPAPAVNAGTYSALTHAASVDMLCRF
jgi:long-subunit fatty acid transport protein